MTAVQEDIEDIIPPSLSATVPASAPVFRLPPEILARIFSTDAESEHETFREAVRDDEGNWLAEDTLDSPRTAGEQVGWINVTHVCRRWREIALGHAALWSSVDRTVSRPWREEMLRRSAQCPLSLYLNLSSSDLEGLHHLIFSNFPRIQHLSLAWVHHRPWPPTPPTSDSERRHFSEFAIALTGPSMVAPLLESLYLHSGLALPALEVTTTSFPALRSLGVAGFRLSLTSSALYNLAHIDDYRVSSTELYAILSRMTKLETISTTLMDDRDPPPLPARPSTVSLPHLTSLIIESFHERSLDLVSRLLTPVTASVIVECHHDSESRHFTHPIMVTFGGGSRPPRAIVLEETDNVQIRLSVDSSDWLESSQPRHGTTTLQFFTDPWPWAPHGDTLLCGGTAVWRGICLDALTHLRLRLETEKVWTKHRWLANFRRAQSVTTIHVHGVRAAPSLLPWRSQDVLPPSVQSDASLAPYVLLSGGILDYVPDVPWSDAEPDARLFPCLEDIVVEDVEDVRDQLVQLDPTVTLYSDSAAMLGALVDRLESRRWWGLSDEAGPNSGVPCEPLGATRVVEGRGSAEALPGFWLSTRRNGRCSSFLCQQTITSTPLFKYLSLINATSQTIQRSPDRPERGTLKATIVTSYGSSREPVRTSRAGHRAMGEASVCGATSKHGTS